MWWKWVVDAMEVSAAVDSQPLDDNLNMLSIELGAEENPEWLAKQNWDMSNTAQWFHCFAEVLVWSFTVAKDA